MKPSSSSNEAGLRLLGATSLAVNPLGLGCVTFGREIDETMARKVLARAMDFGINFCDTSEAYANGASEQVLGKLMQALKLRDRLIICTKARDNLKSKRIAQAAEDSLRRLRTDYLDVYLLHRYDPETPLEESLEAMDLLVRQGKARYVGCSNFNPEQLRRSLDIQRDRGWTRFSVIEPIYNLTARHGELDLFPCCKEANIGIVSYSPLGAGFLTGKYDRSKVVPAGVRFDVKPGHQNIYFNERAFLALDRLSAASATSGLSIASLALRWVFAQEWPHCFLVGARSPEHIEQAVLAWQNRGEPAALMADITAATMPSN